MSADVGRMEIFVSVLVDPSRLPGVSVVTLTRIRISKVVMNRYREAVSDRLLDRSDFRLA
jgi:hypothetical protein